MCLGGKRCSSSCSRATSSARPRRGCDAALGPRNRGLPWQRQPQVSTAAPAGTKDYGRPGKAPGSVLSSPRITPSGDQLLQQLGAGARGALGQRELREVIAMFNPWLLAQLKTNPVCCFCLSFPKLRAHITLPSETRARCLKRTNLLHHMVSAESGIPQGPPGTGAGGMFALEGRLVVMAGLDTAPRASPLCSEEGGGGILHGLSPYHVSSMSHLHVASQHFPPTHTA